MDPDEKTKKKFKSEMTLPQNDPIEDGIIALEELLAEKLQIETTDVRLVKFIKGYKALARKISEMEIAAKGNSEEIYKVKQNMHKSR